MAVEVRRWARTALLVSVYLSLASCLQFFLEEGKQKCFIHDVAEDIELVGEYQTLPSGRQDGSISVVAKDPDNLDVPLRFLSDRRFRFRSKKDGEHQLCLRSGSRLKLDLTVATGEKTVNYTAVAEQERLTELQLRVWQLAEQLLQIQKEQNYQRIREKRFRQISHNTHMWIFWWPVVRSLYVVLFIILVTRSC
ncbi:transmembrane emp24 domain-containing protein 9-like [Salarias fasciatus]|uniref:transmembrane emp24 domain-containing protein 9-like n=1 Tax=Salarias fasciatus TaxID=181472 RepID=UPI001176E441|nr:transmembrane emp24 domain-containing protein 9-like [Salarias fasciatus]